MKSLSAEESQYHLTHHSHQSILNQVHSKTIISPTREDLVLNKVNGKSIVLEENEEEVEKEEEEVINIFFSSASYFYALKINPCFSSPIT